MERVYIDHYDEKFIVSKEFYQPFTTLILPTIEIIQLGRHGEQGNQKIVL